MVHVNLPQVNAPWGRAIPRVLSIWETGSRLSSTHPEAIEAPDECMLTTRDVPLACNWNIHLGRGLQGWAHWGVKNWTPITQGLAQT